MSKILLIEDDATMLSLLCTFLEFEGFQAAPLNGASDVEKMLERLRIEKPELILLDVHLAGLSGFDLMRRIRTDGVLKSTKVLMSSGMDLRNESQQAGADDFILKPYMPEELVKKIHETINNE